MNSELWGKSVSCCSRCEVLTNPYNLHVYRDADCELINDTWKYKSPESIHMVTTLFNLIWWNCWCYCCFIGATYGRQREMSGHSTQQWVGVLVSFVRRGVSWYAVYSTGQFYISFFATSFFLLIVHGKIRCRSIARKDWLRKSSSSWSIDCLAKKERWISQPPFAT